MIKHYVILSFVFLFISYSCNDRKWNNPFDSDCPKDLFTPSDFTAVQQDKLIKLTWFQHNNHISGYKLLQNINDGTWSEIANLSFEITNWTVSGIVGGKKYGYKILAIAGNNDSNEKIIYITPILGADITSGSVSEITSNSATLSGTISSDGGSPILDRGICWGIEQNPTINGNKISNSTGTGSFICFLSGLTPNTVYYVRTYAISSYGTFYGNQLIFTTQSAIATVTTIKVTGITSNSAICGGDVVDDGGSFVSERGICYNTSTKPDISNYKLTIGNGEGLFNNKITGLLSDTRYYVRAYSINSQGIAYGNEVNFKTYSPDGSIWVWLDKRSGQGIETVQIGTQRWMTTNLRYLPYVNPSSTVSSIVPCCYVYGYEGTSVTEATATNSENYINYFKYGVYYNWAAIMQGESGSSNSSIFVQGICPIGYHLPSEEEWKLLEEYLGGNSLAGNKLKSKTEWYDNGNGINSNYFNGFPGGYVSNNGVFIGYSQEACWWSSSEVTSSSAWVRSLLYSNSILNKNSNNKANGYNVRCIRNDENL